METLDRPVLEGDVQRAYVALLGRTPESQAVAVAKTELSLRELLADLLSADEFRSRVLSPVSEGRLLQDGLYGAPPGPEVLAWMAEALPLQAAARAALPGQPNWYGAYAAIFDDAAFGEFLGGAAPRLRDPAFNKGLHLLRDGLGERLVIGAVETVAMGAVSGWALNRRALDERIAVEASVGGVFVAAGLTGRLRRDLQDIYGGQGLFGFELTGLPPHDPQASARQEVEVREAVSKAVIGRAPLGSPREQQADHLRQLRDDLSAIKASVARLEGAFNTVAAGLGHYLADYDAFFRTIYARTPLVEAAERRARDAFVRQPSISIALVLEPARVSELASSLESLAAQSYPPREVLLAPAEGLAVERAAYVLALAKSALGERVRPLTGLGEVPAAMTGERLVFLRAGDRLAPDALHWVATALQGEAAPALVYADEDAIAAAPEGDRHVAPRLKPDFDQDLQLQTGYVGDLLAISRTALGQAVAAGGELSLAARPDLVLRVAEAASPGGIVHIARVLYHARPDLDADTDAAAARAVSKAASAHLQRTNLVAEVQPHRDEIGARVRGAVRLHLQDDLSSVRAAVIIPTRDRLDLIGPCVASLLAASAHNQVGLEIIVVDNGGSLEAGRAFLGSLAASRQVRLVSDEAPFNWGALNNSAARLTDAEVLIFQNDDTVVLTRDGLDELCRQALRPEVGAVGPRLLYEDGSIQHAGVVLGGVNGIAFHEGLGLPGADAGYLGRHALLHRTSAVTGACLATRADVFRRLGGFDEHAFAVEAGDIDYCLRVQQLGLAVLYDPYVTLYHFESKTRGQTGADVKRVESAARELDRLRLRWGERLTRDPYYNPHFDRFSRPFVKLGLPG